ncbi:kinase-like protein [Myriangium duriaei CBS 260.36]|uniref:Kinase-like protein n=1 Tax=Myriangium duriaei CBS 260.36 TaxID=1168546 RepID=A0A9P4IYW9_9PEZI|nr:kinase-like protein [Myriangium duriaei CBS 260.36]
MGKKNVAHLDLKPQNVLYSHDKIKRKYRFIISDWGSSAFYPDSGKVSQVGGTPGFAAPETYVTNNGTRVDKADMWSLCVIMLCVKTKGFYAKLMKSAFSGSAYETLIKNEASRFPPYLDRLAEADPAARATAKDILDSLWLNGSILPEIAEMVGFAPVPSIRVNGPQPNMVPVQSAVPQQLPAQNTAATSRAVRGGRRGRR